ncbi:MAG: HD domain-containing protein [Patescibacteria group bacterium]|jgi:uncharacterized protein
MPHTKPSKHSVRTAVEREVRRRFGHESTGHDFWHIERVRTMALRIARVEKADSYIVELAALTHELDDAKLVKGGHPDKPKRAIAVLRKAGADAATIMRVADAVRSVSFRGAKVKTPAKTMEAKAVQDADRLDANGAIGIARAFAYGGKKGRALHDPSQKPLLHASWEQYQKRDSSTINHLHEKSLLLKDRMQTRTGKKMAEKRHHYLKEYVRQFLKEWKGRIE